MKKVYRLFGIVLSICILLSTFGYKVQAAGTGSVKLSNPSGNVGSTVTVSGTISTSEPFAAATVILSYDQSKIQYVSGATTGGSGSVKIFVDAVDNPLKKSTFSIKFKVLKAETCQLQFETVDVVADSDMDSVSMSKSGGTITGKVQSTSNGGGGTTTTKPEDSKDNRDSNNKLSSLQVYPGTLSPTFASETTLYKVTVPQDTKEVTISATPQSNKARVTVSGNKDLKPGVNEAKVVVVAENGVSIAYNIAIICGEEEKIQIDGKEYTINEKFGDTQIPIGFARTKITYKDSEYEGLTNASNTLSLMSLKNEAVSQFYIYNEETKEFYNFIQISIAEGKYIIPLPPDGQTEDFKEVEKTVLTLQEKTFDAWKLDSEFSVLPILNQDGERLLYRYDGVDGTFQRYVEPEQEEMQQEDQKTVMFPNQYYLYAVVGLASLVLILSVTLIYFVASRKHRHEARKNRRLKQNEKQKAEEVEAVKKSGGKAVKWVLIILSVLVVAGLAAFGVKKYMDAKEQIAQEEQAREEAKILESYVGKPLTELMEKIEELHYDAAYYEEDVDLTDLIYAVKQDYSVAEVQVSDVLKKVKVNLVLNVEDKVEMPEDFSME